MIELDVKNYDIYPHRFEYITQELFQDILKIDKKIIYVDKIACGNGFTTAVMQYAAINLEAGKLGILIEPNKAVCLQKHLSWTTDLPALDWYGGKKNTGRKASYYYQESNDGFDLDQNYLGVFVVDSLMRNLRVVEAEIEKGRMEFICIDEVHTVEYSSLYRPVMEEAMDWLRSLEKRFGEKSPKIIFVTATPNKFTPVDVSIKNRSFGRSQEKEDGGWKIIKPKWNYTENQVASLGRALESWHDPSRTTAIVTNSAFIASQFAVDNVLKANMIAGERFIKSLIKRCTIKHDPELNKYIITSRGHEGIDLYEDNGEVYVFMSRIEEGADKAPLDINREAYSIASIYQVSNRLRKGAIHVEISNRRHDGKRFGKWHELNHNKLLKMYKKLTNNKAFKFMKEQDYWVRICTKMIPWKREGELINPSAGSVKFEVNKTHLNITDEVMEMDNFPHHTKSFDLFLDRRDVEINDLNEVPLKLTRKTLKHPTKMKNIKTNESILKTKIPSIDSVQTTPNAKNYMSQYQTPYIRRVIQDLEIYKAMVSTKEGEGYIDNPRYTKAIAILSDDAILDELVEECSKEYAERSIEKYGIKGSASYIKTWNEGTGKIKVIQLLQAFAQDTIWVPKKVTGHRDYNLYTTVSDDVIDIVADRLDIHVISADITSAYLQIIYQAAGVTLTDDIYSNMEVVVGRGRNSYKKKLTRKEGKILVNKTLNDLMTFKDENGNVLGRLGYDRNMRSKSGELVSMKEQKRMYKQRLKDIQLHEDVVQYLVDTFFITEGYFQKDRAIMFVFCSWYEKKIISAMKEACREAKKKGEVTYDGLGTKHDELKIFNGRGDFSFLNKITIPEFPNFSGWISDEIDYYELLEKNTMVYSTTIENMSAEGEKVLEEIMSDTIDDVGREVEDEIAKSLEDKPYKEYWATKEDWDQAHADYLDYLNKLEDSR